MRGRRSDCQIDGCPGGACEYLVLKDGESRTVCRRCMEELIAMYGWTFGEALIPATSESSGGTFSS